METIGGAHGLVNPQIPNSGYRILYSQFVPAEVHACCGVTQIKHRNVSLAGTRALGHPRTETTFVEHLMTTAADRKSVV